jgi:hypothetical protein
MKLYSCDIRIYGTAYAMADSEKEARAIFKDMKNDVLHVDGDDICDQQFADMDTELSLSPAMTIHGPDRGAPIEEVHDYGDDEDEAAHDEAASEGPHQAEGS